MAISVEYFKSDRLRTDFDERVISIVPEKAIGEEGYDRINGGHVENADTVQ